MKKILILLAAVCFVGLTSSKCSFERKVTDPEPDVDTLAPTPSAADLIVMVYSNAYDGFLNIREQPDTKSPIIGKIVNGPMGAVKMGEIGGWTIVKVGDTIGYASSRYLQTEPTDEFTDKDMEKCIQGIWTTSTPMDQRQIMLFQDNLFYEGYTLEGLCYCGTWSVTGTVLSLHTVKSMSESYGWAEDPHDEVWTIVSGDQIKDDNSEPMKRVKIMTEKAYNDKDDAGYGMDWYEVDEYHFTSMYEGAYLAVKGSYPPGI